MYSVYVLVSLKDGKHYTGSTSNLERRIKQHNQGKTESTRRRRPFKLIYQEEHLEKEEAEERERFLKSGKGREELKQLLSGAVPHPPKAG
jgi:putative endonuclease